MNMKIRITLCLIFCIGTLYAQNGERIRAAKVAFITNQLDLTVEESQQFWPIYNEMESKVQEIKQSVKANTSLDLMNDEELENHLLGKLNGRKQEAEVHLEYYQRFREVLPIRKLAKLPGIENEFKQHVLKKMQEERRKRIQERMNNDSPKG